jgi:hypothetical protein
MITEKDFYKVAAATIQARKGDVITLIRKNGIAINNDATNETITNGVLSLIKTSKPFRDEFATLILNNKESYANAEGDGKEPPIVADEPKKQSYLSQLFTPEFTRSALDNIMNIVSVRMGAGSTTPYSELNQAYYNTPEPERKGLGVGGMIAIGVGAIGLIALVVYLAKKK